jgi:hypothetical protein
MAVVVEVERPDRRTAPTVTGGDVRTVRSGYIGCATHLSDGSGLRTSAVSSLLVTDIVMPSNSGDPRTMFAVRLLRRAGGILIALIGVIALIVGIVLMVSQGWNSATGAIQSCQVRLVNPRGVGTSTGTGATYQQTCVVTWTNGGIQRTGSLSTAGRPFSSGQAVALRVHGNQVVEATSRWEGYVATAVGLVLLVGGVVFARRAWRSSRH